MGADRCSVAYCQQERGLRRKLSKRKGYFVGKDWFCSVACLETALSPVLKALMLGGSRAAVDRSLRPTLGLMLLEQGHVSREALESALAVQRERPDARIGEVLQELGCVSERDVTLALSRQFRIPWVNFVKGEISESAVRLVPAVVARAFQAVPVDYRSSADVERRLLVAIVGPPDYGFLRGLSRMLDLEVSALVADESRVHDLLDRFYPESLAAGRRVDATSLSWEGLAIAVSALGRKYQAEELRLERCGRKLWVRLFKEDRRSDFLFDVAEPAAGEVYVS